MGTRNMYEYNNAANTTAREKSISPLKVFNKAPTSNKTPVKTTVRTPIKNQTVSKTPVKNTTTANKNTTAAKTENSKTPTKSTIKKYWVYILKIH